ncbi:MAG: glutaminyl-peptide cyclotransferase [Flavobacteriaceae bacterium TMED238]|nr:glutamine cyclotransferase [Flavobacteriales bacterium]RPG60840.1 MAG: glutaminyl-peptide cyclotransferase [Flavobacteriaceae bacterium TMED238]
MRYYIILLTFLISCGTKTSNEYEIITTSSDKFLKKSSFLSVSVKGIDNNLNIDYFLNGNKVNSKIDLSKSKLGTNNLEAIILINNEKISISKEIDVYSSKSPNIYSYDIINEYNHDISSYTQGLEFNGNYLYESTGLNGFSSLKKIDLFKNKVIETRFLDKQYFGEGLTIINNKILQLTWKSKVGFIYDLDTFEMQGSFDYGTSSEGWGLANDGQNVYKSDGTEKIWILDSKNFNELDYIEVVTNNKKIKNINELEIVDDLIYANTYQFNNDVCVIINKDTGEVIGIINFKGLRDKVRQHPELDVLNGIAYNKKRKTFFVTGKKWNKIFEIKIFKS